MISQGKPPIGAGAKPPPEVISEELKKAAQDRQKAIKDLKTLLDKQIAALNESIKNQKKQDEKTLVTGILNNNFLSKNRYVDQLLKQREARIHRFKD